jgi:hypothetical protein
VQQSPRDPAALVSVSELALVVVECEGVAARLMAAHVDDGRGHCRGCWLPQAPPPIWPCTLFAVGREARKLDRVRRLPGR